jgi:hypothetical protein
MDSNNNYQKYNTDFVLRDYFKDIETYNFKYGLQYGLSSNLSETSTGNGLMSLDEDPTVLGFDAVILDGSPLFNQIDSFFQFGDDNSIQDITYRREIYQDFISQFAKFFNVDDRNRGDFKTDGRFNSFKTHYLESVSGLNKMIHSAGIGGKGLKSDGRQFTDFGTDKITFRISEDVNLNAGYLSALYRNLMYAKRKGRQVIPENLMRFDMVIILSEIRNFNRIANSFSKIVNRIQNPEFIPGMNDLSFTGETNQFDPNTPEYINSYQNVNELKVFNENINRYIFTLYDCQLDFREYSFEDSITQAGLGTSLQNFSKGFGFDVYYKYVGFEMEKFDFNPSAKNGQLKDIPKFVNDIKNNPSTFQVNTEGDLDTSSDKFPNRPYDLRYQRNTAFNSEEARSYIFDFPMINAKYARDVRDVRNRNLEIAADQGRFRTGLNSLIDQTNNELKQRFVSERAQLIRGLAEKVRGVTGLRNLKSPINVYHGTNLAQYALGKVQDFANLAVGTAISSGVGFLNDKAKGLETAIFDKTDNGINRLKGFENFSSSESPLSTRGGSTIPNVYKR